MTDAVEAIRETVQYDVDPDFLRSAAVNIAWEYRSLYDELATDPALPIELKGEIFAKRRSACAVRALVAAARQHGVPWEFRRLECNGQQKLLLKAGRVVLIQEPMLTLEDAPNASDYKKKLAQTYGLVCQLEVDLGDLPNRVLDWSGEILAVVLHGASGPSFSERDRELGGLFLAVPNAAYDSWVIRFDLFDLAMFGSGKDVKEATRSKEVDQADRVVIRLRRGRGRSTGTEK